MRRTAGRREEERWRIVPRVLRDVSEREPRRNERQAPEPSDDFEDFANI
jgi:hypothetical protein